MDTISGSTSPLSKSDQIKYTKYGKYVVEQNSQFELPGISVSITRINEDKFSYQRKSKNETVEKIISIRTDNLEMELVPILPIYMPSHKTDFMFFRLTKPLFVSRNSTTEVFYACPIEIGLFFTGSEIREHFDLFSCEPTYSRYALYGQPDQGRLCKFAKVEPQAQPDEITSYVHGVLRTVIENELDAGVSISKIVFPMTDHDIYYSGSNAAFDHLKVVIKERVGVQVADIVQQDSTGPQGWTRSPRNNKKTDYKFAMEFGID